MKLNVDVYLHLSSSASFPIYKKNKYLTFRKGSFRRGLLVVCDRFLVVSGYLLVVCGCLMLICGRLLLAGSLWLFAGGLW